MELYRPKHRLAEELLPLAQTALAGQGNAAVDAGTNSLLLVGDGPALRRALELLAQQDRALRNVVLHYESRTANELDAAGIRVAWGTATGSFRIGNARVPEGGAHLFVEPELSQLRGSGTFGGTLRVLEGQSGQIATGVDVPVTTLRSSRFGVEERTSFASADSGFWVTPRVLGDGSVRLDFAPFDARIAGQMRAGLVVEHSGAETTITAKPGDTVALAGLSTAVSVRGADAAGAQRSSLSGERIMLLRVELE